MFNEKANGVCNNTVFNYENIPPMHPTMKRLYEAAQQLHDRKGQTDVATLLGVSPQMVNNWESRGVSQQAMIDAEETVGCRAIWVRSGVLPMTWMAHAAMSGSRAPEAAPEVREFVRSLEGGGPAKREALLRLAALPEQEMGTLLLVLQSISEKYSR